MKKLFKESFFFFVFICKIKHKKLLLRVCARTLVKNVAFCHETGEFLANFLEYYKIRRLIFFKLEKQGQCLDP
jgi:hypothetical protein